MMLSPVAAGLTVIPWKMRRLSPLSWLVIRLGSLRRTTAMRRRFTRIAS